MRTYLQEYLDLGGKKHTIKFIVTMFVLRKMHREKKRIEKKINEKKIEKIEKKCEIFFAQK